MIRSACLQFFNEPIDFGYNFRYNILVFCDMYIFSEPQYELNQHRRLPRKHSAKPAQLVERLIGYRSEGVLIISGCSVVGSAGGLGVPYRYPSRANPKRRKPLTHGRLRDLTAHRKVPRNCI